MPLGTLDRSPPPFFRQGPSALSKLMVYSAIACLLMVADTRFAITQPLRVVVAAVLQPLQWLVMQPIEAARNTGAYFSTVKSAQNARDVLTRQLSEVGQRAALVEQLQLENTRLRELLDLRERLSSAGQAAQVLYDAADPYSRKVILDRGLVQQVRSGSPVIDESGVLGQVTRVYATTSEVTLLTDPEQAIPVLNARTGLRAVAFGNPGVSAGSLELRYISANADVEVGDLLTTSGVDGVYPPGLPVAKVVKVDRRSDSAFARIECEPVARVNGALHVIVLEPLTEQVPERPQPEDKKGRRK
jgi:rod shape-determining protein MreC